MLLLSFLAILPSGKALSQTVFSRFDFNTSNLMLATIGPDATYIDPDARRTNGAAYMRFNCGSNKGFDLLIPNENNVFDVPSFGMRFRWEKHENFAHFFDRGNGHSFYIDGGMLFMKYRIQNGITPNGGITMGPFATGYFAPNDNQFHEYVFEYKSSTGVAEVRVDGNLVWTFDGPDGRDLLWDSNIHPVVGTIMDGTCDQQGILDFVEFYIPDESLPVDFLDVRASWEGTSAQIEWVTMNEVNNDFFTVERSADGYQFEEVGQVGAAPTAPATVNSYELEDRGLTRPGTWWYRVRQTDHDGQTSHSESVRVEVDAAAFNVLQASPNPSNGQFQLQYREGARSLQVVALDGRKVYEQAIPASEGFPVMQVRLPRLVPGIYHLLVLYPGRQESLKLVIQE